MNVADSPQNQHGQPGQQGPLKISVITVVRNGRDFVGQTIQSVLDQQYQPVEYIVVDGGSTDGTVDIIKSHGDRISKWISEPDSGISDAFNKGLALSGGDYLLFLNADDRLASPEVVGRMVQAIVDEGYPELIYGDCAVIDRQTGRYLYTASIEFVPRAFKMGRTFPHPSLFTSRSYFDRYGQFDTDFGIAMDYEFFLRGALASRVVHTKSLVTEVRNGGMSTNRAAAVEEIVRALRKNGIVRTAAGAWALRGYFGGRSFMRKAREALMPSVKQ